MSVTYAVEPWHDCKTEVKALFPLHWAEIAHDRQAIPLDPDYEAYDRLADDGLLHCVIVRHDGAVIGYHGFVVRGHLHYKSTLMAFTDLFYVLPAYRAGYIGIKMFQFAEQSLISRGVKKIFLTTKMAINLGPIFRRLGYNHVEDVYAKTVG